MVVVKDPHLVYHNIHVCLYKTTKLCKFGLNWSLKLQKNDDREKTPLLQQVVCFQMPNKRLKSFKM